MFRRNRLQDLGETGDRGIVATHILLEIDLNLEQLVEIGIQPAQHVVKRTVANQDDLDVERDWLRLQRYGADQAHHLAEGLDLDMLGAQRALQRLPGIGLHEQAQGVDHQEAAIGSVQGAGLDQGEIGQQRAHLGDMFDPPDQVGVGRQVFLHHRRAGAVFTVAPVADHDVDLIAPLGTGLRAFPARGQHTAIAATG